MPGDDFKRVGTGDPLIIPARTWNALLDAAEAEIVRRIAGRRGEHPLVSGARAGGTVLIQNDSGSNIGRFEVLGIDGLIIGPGDSLDGFKERIALSGVTPAVPDHLGKFAVAQQPIPNGEIGPAKVSGTTIVMVTWPGTPGHTHADVTAGDRTSLTAAWFGSARILYRDVTYGWAVVRLGDPSPEITLAMKCTANWVTDGTATGNESYVMGNPCKIDGTSVDAGTDWKGWLPRGGKRLDPYAFTGMVLPVFRIDHSHVAADDAVCCPNQLWGKVNETVVMHWDMANIPTGWTALTAAKGRLLRAWDDSTAPGVTGGADPWATDGASQETTDGPSSTTNVGSGAIPVGDSSHTHDLAHTHNVSSYPPNIRAGLIMRTS